MPIYEYRCEQCGSISEFLVSRMGGTPADLKCSQCGGEKMSKALSTIAVHAAAGADALRIGRLSRAGGPADLLRGQVQPVNHSPGLTV